MWRQGDVLIVQVESFPENVQKRPNLVLAEGEITGHCHQIKEADAAELLELDGILYLKVIAPSATLVHDEHNPITLDQGYYRVWRQREYTPDEIRTVYD